MGTTVPCCCCIEAHPNPVKSTATNRTVEISGRDVFMTDILSRSPAPALRPLLGRRDTRELSVCQGLRALGREQDTWGGRAPPRRCLHPVNFRQRVFLGWHHLRS